MGISSGADVYKALSETKSPWGSFMDRMHGFQDFFQKRKENELQDKVQDAMDEKSGDLAAALGEQDYARAAKLATEAGDYERADAYARLANDKEQQQANIAYRNALLESQRFQLDQKAAEKAEKDAAEKAEQDRMRSSAVSAIRELKDLADSGAIWAGNNATGGMNLFGEGGKAVGRRTAALSALLPMTNAIARSNGGSGINTVGEMMAYLGMPENATSAQIKGALPGLMTRLGITDADLANIDGSANNNMAVGAVVDGYVFLGGNPADPNNWRAK